MRQREFPVFNVKWIMKLELSRLEIYLYFRLKTGESKLPRYQCHRLFAQQIHTVRIRWTMFFKWIMYKT